MNAINILTDNTDAVIVDRHEISPTPERLTNPPLKYQTECMRAWFASMTGSGEKIWHHQALGLKASSDDKNVVLATGTGSGKSLVFQAAVVADFVGNPHLTAFAFYPTKALASDQIGRWKNAFRDAGLDENSVVEIHGDISMTEREQLLPNARLIVCTPDILHAWFMRLLSSTDAQRFIRNLSICVIDEAHNLEGVFGSNCAYLFRRVRAAKRRSVLAAGSLFIEIRFVAASATVADPAGHLKALTGLPFVVIDESQNGAPTQAKTLLHIEGPEHGAVAETAMAEIITRIAGKIAPNAMIAFAEVRQMVERIASSAESKDVECYRAGFDKTDRNVIESGMRTGSLRAVVATSALELGIDVPQFTLGLNVGVPTSKKQVVPRLSLSFRPGLTGLLDSMLLTRWQCRVLHARVKLSMSHSVVPQIRCIWKAPCGRSTA